MKDIAELPDSVREELVSGRFISEERGLYDRYALSGSQRISYADALMSIVFKERPVSDLLTLLTRMPGADHVDLKSLARETAEKQLWPISYYLDGVDLLISRLGGRVPSEKPTPRASTASAVDPATEQGTAKEMLADHPEWNELYLTQKPMKDMDDRLKAPSVKNWLAEYLHTVGASEADSLKRSQFLAKSRNAVRLNEEEKLNLLNFLASYQDDVPMYWRIAEDQYLVVQSEPVEKSEKFVSGDDTKAKLDEMLDRLQSVHKSYERLFQEKKAGLEIELRDSPTGLGDVIWESLGLGERERCLAAINLMIERHGFLELLKTDRRFQGIVARAIDAHYGTVAKNSWNGDLTTGVMLTFFWRLMLVEKLGMPEDDAAIVADLYRKKMLQKKSPLYADVSSGSFRFREIAYENKAFSFVRG